MRKKLWIGIITLTVVFVATIAYTTLIFDTSLLASSSYRAGGAVTGRIHKMPSGLTSSTSGLRKGDKFLTGVTNPGHTSEKIAFQLIANQKYTDYGCLTSGTANPETVVCNNSAITAWLGATTNDVGTRSSGMTAANLVVGGKYSRYTSWAHLAYGSYVSSTTLPPFVKSLTDSIKNDSNLLTYRNLQAGHNFYSTAPTRNPNNTNQVALERDFVTYGVFSISSTYNHTQNNLFLPGEDIGSSIPANDLKFKVPYAFMRFYRDSYVTACNYALSVVLTNGTTQWTGQNTLTNGYAYYIRPFGYFRLDNTVFGVSPGSNTDIAKVTSPSLSSSYTNLYADASGREMKLRLENQSLTNSTSFDQIQDSNGNVVNKIVKNKTVYLDASAQAGSDGAGGVNTVSAIVFDKDNNFVYYRPLESAKGDGTYEFDTTGIQTGVYKIGIVNEVYNENSTTPSNSSAIIGALPLEIVEPVSVSVTPKSNLQYQLNVNQGDVVAQYVGKDGIAPITYTLVSDTTQSGHENDYEKFDLSGTDIIVKDPNGLQSKDYYFKVKAVDVNGDPVGGAFSATVKITVAKADPALAFTDANPVYKAIGDTAFTESFTHQNTDANYTISYSSSLNNVASVNTWNSGDSSVTITPGSMTGTTTITVTLAESDNFKAATISKTVKVVPKLLLNFNAAKHAFASGDVAASGSVVGTITLTGDSANYTYSMATDPNAPAGSDADNALFVPAVISATPSKTVNLITTQADIPQGTYRFTIKAEDAYGQVVYTSGSITVAGIAQTGFEFYDYTNITNVLTDKTLTIYYGESGAKLIAQGGESTGAVTYDLEAGEPNDVITVNQTTGAITVHNIGTVKVKAIKGSDSTYGETVIHMDVEVKPCEQEIAFANANKTIISYDDVNGHTFTETAAAKIKSNMPNGGSNGVGAITYTLSGTNANIAQVDAHTGAITILPGLNITTKQTFNITATITDANGQYTTASVMKEIEVYPAGNMTWTQTNVPQADNNSVNEKVGDVTMSGGTGNYVFAIPAKSSDNPDADYFQVDPATGEVSIKQTIDHNVLSTKWNPTTQRYEMQIVVEIDDNGNKTIKPIIIEMEGAVRTGIDFKNRDALTKEITEVYGPNKHFQLVLTQNISNVTYRTSTKHNNPSDVVELDTSVQGQVNILNANEKQIGGSTIDPYYVEAVIPQADGYKETIIEAPIRIKRAQQQLQFSQDPINTSADIQSVNVTISGHNDSKAMLYTSSDNEVDADADPNDTNQVIIRTNQKVVSGVIITAMAQGDRNYKEATQTATLNIAESETPQFVAVFPSMTYGDTAAKKVTINPSDENSTYSYEVKDTNIIEIAEDGTITIYNAGTTRVEVIKTDANGSVGPYSYQVTVKPKPIKVTIEDKAKYVGMTMPPFTASIPTNELVGNDTLGTLTYRCLDENGAQVDANTKAGTYEISGNYANGNANYKITIEKGTLTINQDEGEEAWYHLEDKDGKTTTSSVWHQGSVDVVLDAASAGTYDQIGNTPAFLNATSNPKRFTVTQEGESIQDVYFRIDPNGSDPNKGAVTKPVQTTIRIDNTKPIIKSITGVNKPSSTAGKILNSITMGNYFKPGMIVTIQAEDVEPSPGVKISEVAKTTYVVNKLDGNRQPIGTPDKGDYEDDTVEVTLTEMGTYRICAIAMDHAGNESDETCKEFTVKGIGIDSDGDGIPDINIDIDGDGIPDINVTKNPDDPNDKIPVLNIDTDGDGKPDVNVDVDGDGIPDLNTGIVKEWHPNTPVDIDGDGIPDYMTDSTIKGLNNIDTDKDGYPDLNIDIDKDGLPDLNINTDGKFDKPQTNIDSDGDGIADINVDEDSDGIPDKNVMEIKEWKPQHNVSKDGKVIYDTMKITYQPIYELEDNGIKITSDDPNHSFLPNMALKVEDVTGTRKEEVQNAAADLIDAKQAIKTVYDVKLLKDGKEIQPDGKVKIKIPIDDDIRNAKLIMKGKDGVWRTLQAQTEAGYYVFETDTMGEIGVIGDITEDAIDDPKPNLSDQQNNVQGIYYPGDNVGGANTADVTNAIMYVWLAAVALVSIVLLLAYKQRQED